MRDINFFQEYLEKTEFKIEKKLIYISLSILLILSLIFYSLYNSIVIRNETKLVNNLKTVAEDPKIVERVNKILEKEIKVNEFKESVEKIKFLNETIEDRDIIDEILLETITAKMPEDLFLTSLGIYNGEIEIVGIAKDKWSIAEFEKGLEDLKDIEEIFISNISLQDDCYNFTLDIGLKRGDMSGKESYEQSPMEDESVEEDKN